MIVGTTVVLIVLAHCLDRLLDLCKGGTDEWRK